MRIAVVDVSAARAAIIEEGLRDAGLHDITLLTERRGLAAALDTLKPDVVLMDLANPSRDLLEESFMMSRALFRPIAMFVDQSDEATTGEAIDAGVSAYVVDGLRRERIKPIVDLAIKRFTAFAHLQRELHEARTELAEHKTLERAKAFLMSDRGIGEPEAYALLRRAAMNQGKRIVDIADALLTASSLLRGRRD
jgi:response regulator NasT